MGHGQIPDRVSAADFIRGFASWRLQSARRPVVVTHHGKDAHVLISLDDYRRLDSDTCQSGNGRLEESQILLMESVRDCVILIDREQRIAALNPAASDMLEVAASNFVSQPLAEAVPTLETSVLFPHILRMIDHRERFTGELPSLLRPGQWLRADLIPLPVGGAIVLRDISETLAAREAAGTQQAVIRAIDIEGGIGHASVSVRETVEYANQALLNMIGVNEHAVRRVRFSALLPLTSRNRFSEAIETLFQTGEPMRLESGLVSREGAIVPVTLSIVERRGIYGSDGAAILVTPR